MSTYYGPGTDDISFVPLTVDEEKALFKRFYESNDLAARDELIKRHLKLIAKLSLQFAKRALPEDDAISAGNFGLMQALDSKNFKPEYGVRFATYVRQYVLGQICAALREVGKMNKDREMTNGLTVDGNSADDMTVTGARAGHDTYAGNSLGGYHFKSAAGICEPAVDHEYENLQLNEERRYALHSALEQLPKTEAAAVRGFELEGKSHPEIGVELGISRQASQQAYWRGMEKLKVILASRKAELV